MSLTESLAPVVVVLAGAYLIALGAASLVVPARAGRFLLGFASSRVLHFTEMFLRLLVGAALVLHAPRMAWPGAFRVFGGVLLVTSVCLVLVPWQWHRRFAGQVVPLFTRHVAWIGIVSLALGSGILWAVARGAGA